MPPAGWRYNLTSTSFWHDVKVRGWTDDARFVACYVLMCPGRSGEGFFHASLATAADDMGWPRERFDAAFAELRGSDFLDWDEAARLVFIVKALKHHPPIKGPASIKGALNVLDEAQ